jgi:hypothetical protein
MFSMSLYRLVFPSRYRRFTGKRWVNIGLRTAHLLGVTGLGGAVVCGMDPEIWRPYLWLTVVTGAFMMAIEVWSSAIYLIQMRGLAMLVKVLVLGAFALAPGTEAAMVVLAVVVSGVVSHAPASIRYYSIFHRRMIDAQ